MITCGRALLNTFLVLLLTPTGTFSFLTFILSYMNNILLEAAQIGRIRYFINIIILLMIKSIDNKARLYITA